jgi:uncharacterized protein
MIIEFTVGNYKSFKEPVTFSMVASNLTSKDKALDENNIFAVNKKLSLLKSAAIYGANASGKSNFVKALNFIRKLVIDSATKTQTSDPINVDIFRLHEDTENQPAYFEIVFILEGMQYRYGFEVTAKRVVSEWLYYVPTIREAELFTRDAEGIHIPKGSKFKEGRGLEIRTRDNALFLSVVAQFNGEIAVKVIKWFRSLIIFPGFDANNQATTMDMLEKVEYKNRIINFLKNFDLGFEDLALNRREIKMPEEDKIRLE